MLLIVNTTRLEGAETLRLTDTEWTEANFVAGALCLDFSNTLSGGMRGQLRDRLPNYTVLIDWFLAAGLIDDAERGQFLKRVKPNSSQAKRIHAQAVQLREAIFDMFCPLIAGHSPAPSALALLNETMCETSRMRKIVWENERFAWQWMPSAGSPEPLLGRIAYSAADLLVNSNATLIKKCKAESCAWLYIDTSKNRSRVWCDMAVCGNRAKSRRYLLSNSRK